MGISDWWCSPSEIADPLEEFFGGPVGVDPCSNPHSIIRAIHTLYEGGLVLPWTVPPGKGTAARRGSAYENPPYSQGEVWTAKAIDECNSGRVTELVRLTMMSTSTEWWAAMCYRMKRNPRILGITRLCFIDPATGEQADACRFEPALTYVGPRTALFTKTFAHLTRWSTWGR